MKYLVRLSYMGTKYYGFQSQPSGNTISDILCDASKKIFNKDCKIAGCSRTDSGVHAFEYYATIEFDGEASIGEDSIVRAINTYLPQDISVNDVHLVENDFSIHKAVDRKEYVYLIYSSESKIPFLENRALQYRKEIDIDVLNKACEYFVGEHDFSAFMSVGSSVETTIRTIYSCNIKYENGIYKFSIEGNGFLYNMVRIIVGTLIEVNEGKIKPEDIKSIIESKDRNKAGRTISPCGLYLNKVILKNS